MNTIDLNTPPPNHVYSITVEREESTVERNVRLFKDLALFLVAVGFVLAIAIVCFRTVSSASASADEKKGAMSVLSAAAGGRWHRRILRQEVAGLGSRGSAMSRLEKRTA